MIFHVFLLLLFPHASPIYVQKRIKLRPNKQDKVLYKVNDKPFGFLEGANVTIELSCDKALRIDSTTGEPTLMLFMCPRGLHDVSDEPLASICNEVEQQYNKNAPNNMMWMNRIPKTEFLQMYLKERDHKTDSDECSLSYFFLNPGGNHLSSDQIFIPTNYIIILVTWLCAASVWLLNFICYRKYSNSLHKLLSLIIFIKVINICLSLILWTQYNNNGRVTIQIDVTHMLSSTSFYTALFMLLMLAGEGWCIIWERPRLLKYYTLLAAAFFLMDLCYKYVHSYFQGFAIVFATMMIYIAFKCSSISVATIKKNITASTQFIEIHKLTYKSKKTLKKRLDKKMKLFCFLQGLILGLPCILIVVESVASFLLAYNEWLRRLLLELLAFAVIIYCCILFRLQNFEQYNNVTIATPYHDVTVLRTPARHIVYISGGNVEEKEEEEVNDDQQNESTR